MGVFGARRLGYGTIGTGFEAVQSRDGRGGLGNIGGMESQHCGFFLCEGSCRAHRWYSPCISDVSVVTSYAVGRC
jgi:hypothetical protein